MGEEEKENAAENGKGRNEMSVKLMLLGLRFQFFAIIFAMYFFMLTLRKCKWLIFGKPGFNSYRKFDSSKALKVEHAKIKIFIVPCIL